MGYATPFELHLNKPNFNRMEKTNKIPKISESQKKEQVLRFIQQKREMYATGIYFNAVRGSDGLTAERARELATASVAGADALLEILYPLRTKEGGGE